MDGTELYRVVQSCTEWYECRTELYGVVHSRTELYRVVQCRTESGTELYGVVLHSSGTVLQSCTEWYRVVRSCTEIVVVQSCTEWYRVVRSCT